MNNLSKKLKVTKNKKRLDTQNENIIKLRISMDRIK